MTDLQEDLLKVVEDKLSGFFEGKCEETDIKLLLERCKVLINCIDKSRGDINQQVQECRELINQEIYMFMNEDKLPEIKIDIKSDGEEV